MNRLSIILAIALVSYSLGAPENISESQNGVQNHGLEHGSDQGLEKQDGFENGNVNVDTSTSDPSEIEVFGKKSKPKPSGGGRNKVIDKSNPTKSNGEKRRTAVCATMCSVACLKGAEAATCLMCMSRCA